MVLRIGHRGAAGYEPENTILSFRKAISLRVDYIELDVHLSKDKIPVVMHDGSLDRTTNGKGRISEKPVSEIKKYRTKDKNQPVPTLQEIINKLKGKTKFNIEVKGIKPAEKTCELIKKNKIEKDVIVSSNHVSSLLTVKKNLPELKTALIYYATKTTLGQYIFVFLSLIVFPLTKSIILNRAKLANVNYINLSYPFATRNFIKKLHKFSFKVNVWTVNKKDTIQRMKELHVDGIISDFPDRI